MMATFETPLAVYRAGAGAEVRMKHVATIPMIAHSAMKIQPGV